METVKSRSESPFSRSKAKSHSLDTSENGDVMGEQLKKKKKNRNKCKQQSNGKEAGDLVKNGNDYPDEEGTGTNETDNNVGASSNGEPENGINNGEGIENGNGTDDVPEMDDNEMDALVSARDSAEEKAIIESNGKLTKNGTAEEHKSTEAVEVEEESTERCDNSETESGAKKDSFIPCDSLAETGILCESSEETCNGGATDVGNGETNLTHEQESTVDCSEIKDSSQISVNGSDGSSHYEEANAAEDHIQASPDTATKDDNSISNKITNFLGKWSHSQEQKQDSNVSSSKKTEENTFSHPYLSKVSGRRGIKDRLNSSATVLGTVESKTPENSGKISLDDSFRVRTNPPRLHSSDLTENSTLRKFKGKRCLNAGDEPEEEEDETYGNNIKRRKLEKDQEPGLLGGILWSPFRKRTLDNGDQMKMTTAESKLSRLLSPFWFWKRTAAGQKGK